MQPRGKCHPNVIPVVIIRPSNHLITAAVREKSFVKTGCHRKGLFAVISATDNVVLSIGLDRLYLATHELYEEKEQYILEVFQLSW